MAVEERDAPVEGVGEPLVERDTTVLEPVVEVVPVLLTLALAETLAVGATVRVPTAVAETVAVPMLDLLGFMVPDPDTEAVDVFVLEGEPLPLRVCIGLYVRTEAEAEALPDSGGVRVGPGVAVWNCVKLGVALTDLLEARVGLPERDVEGDMLWVLDPRPEPLPEPLLEPVAVPTADADPVCDTVEVRDTLILRVRVGEPVPLRDPATLRL